jgi:hypothetical protein
LEVVPSARRKRSGAAVAADESKAAPAGDGADVDRTVASRRRSIRRQGEEEDVVLAAVEGAVEGVVTEGPGELGRRHRKVVADDGGSNAALQAEAVEIERETVRDVDRRAPWAP